MQFNQYSLYSLNTQDKVQEFKSKIFDDIKRMEKITEYYDILDFIEGNYSHKEGHLLKDFSDDVKLEILLEENVTQVLVKQKDKVLFGRKWTFTPDESTNDTTHIEFKTPEIIEDNI